MINSENQFTFRLFIIDTVVVLSVLLFNIYIRSITVVKFATSGETQEILMVRKYADYFPTITLISVVIIIVTLIVSLLLLNNEQKRVKRRLSVLVNLFRQIGLTEIDAIDPILTDYELQVIDAWNDSVHEINHQKDQREKYIKGMVHDLKTPIQILKANARMFLLEFGDNEYVDAIRDELELLERTILKYLVVEKITYFEKVTLTHENIADYFEKIISRYQKLGFAITIKYLNTYNYFNVDKQMLSKIIVNIIENAMKHGVEKSMEIVIDDQQINFTNRIADDLEISNIFNAKKRYYSTNGNGLGIDIIKTYTKLLKWHVSSSKSGDKFTVELRYANIENK